jgi:L-asparagine oxygenase
MLPDRERDHLLTALGGLGSPYEDLEEFLFAVYPIFACLPREILEQLLKYRSDPAEYGAVLLENFPVDPDLPKTPGDGRRSGDKTTFISEACVLGVGQILGQPVGYHDEKDGEVIHNLCPVQKEACATSSESSLVDLGFHTDFNYDKDNPDQPYNVVNPDYVVLVCLRQDRKREACTMYVDVRDLCQRLTVAQMDILRRPLFQFAASYSFTSGCGSGKIWSVPCPVIKGPDTFPEISIDLLCGVRAVSDEADDVLKSVRELCRSPNLAGRVYLKPGDILLMDNRKGAHGRTSFTAFYDGHDRWLQRIYVRRSLWEMRKPSNPGIRVF